MSPLLCAQATKNDITAAPASARIRKDESFILPPKVDFMSVGRRESEVDAGCVAGRVVHCPEREAHVARLTPGSRGQRHLNRRSREAEAEMIADCIVCRNDTKSAVELAGRSGDAVAVAVQCLGRELVI